MAKKQKQKKTKLKTHKAAASRLHLTGSGRLMRLKGQQSHLRRRRSARAKRMYGSKLPVTTSDVARLRRLIPYGTP